MWNKNEACSTISSSADICGWIQSPAFYLKDPNLCHLQENETSSETEQTDFTQDDSQQHTRTELESSWLSRNDFNLSNSCRVSLELNILTSIYCPSALHKDFEAIFED